MDIILASKSPRRRDILKLAESNFDVIDSNIEEREVSFERPEIMVTRLAFQKAMSVAAEHPESLVIGADTTVVIDGRILGKPKSYDEAFDMIRMLSGRVHKVITGISVIKLDELTKINDYTISQVRFRELTDEDIKSYLDKNDYIDKAGAYGIQGIGSILVEGLYGDYMNVVGMSLTTLDKLFKKATGRGIIENR